MSNQEAIALLRNLEDALDSYCELNEEGKIAFRMATEALELFGNSEQLPSAQPESLVNESRPLVKDLVKDTISRQAVIDRISKQREHLQPDIYPQDKIGDAAYRICAEFIERLPSVQPEIIRCKDCKHHWTHRCMDSMPTEICDLNQTFYDPNIDFCSLAERRTDE